MESRSFADDCRDLLNISVTAALLNIAPVEVVILCAICVCSRLLRTRLTSRSFTVLVVPADVPSGSIRRGIVAPVVKRSAGVVIVWTRWHLVYVSIIREDATFTGFAVETLIVPFGTSSVERSWSTVVVRVPCDTLLIIVDGSD